MALSELGAVLTFESKGFGITHVDFDSCRDVMDIGEELSGLLWLIGAVWLGPLGPSEGFVFGVFIFFFYFI
jgi:hypothetical protein